MSVLADSCWQVFLRDIPAANFEIHNAQYCRKDPENVCKAPTLLKTALPEAV